MYAISFDFNANIENFTKESLKKFFIEYDKMNERFNTIDKRFNVIDERFNTVYEKIDNAMFKAIISTGGMITIATGFIGWLIKF